MRASIIGASKLAGLYLLVVAGMLAVGVDTRTVEATTLNEVQKLLQSDFGGDDRFGTSVAIDGDTAVVGAPNADTGAVTQHGAVYVFQRSGSGAGDWTEVKKITASDLGTFKFLGRSVAISGDTIVAGASVSVCCTMGAAYVFQRDQGGGDNWGEVKKLTPSVTEVNDNFGLSVAVDGDTAIVGARREDTAGIEAGAAYVFQRDHGGEDNWGEVRKLFASDAEAIDHFGISAAVSGDVAIVGAYLEDGGLGGPLGDAGAAYVFHRDAGGSNNWGEVKKLTASDAEAADQFGRSVAAGGDTIFVGANLEDTAGNFAGAAYVFERDEGGADNWGEVKKLTAADGDDHDEFGFSVAITGDLAAVGAQGDESVGPIGSGSAYLFERNLGGPNNWGETNKLSASDAATGDRLGWSVAVDGNSAFVGAPLEDPGAPALATGAAYVFRTAVDSDKDGCTDAQENGANVTLGGLRDPMNPWDFYDVETISGPGKDGVVDLLFDVLNVINHYSPDGSPPYDAHYDRGPSAGPNPWNMTAPDGSIDLLNDILGAVQQISHDCT